MTLRLVALVTVVLAAMGVEAEHPSNQYKVSSGKRLQNIWKIPWKSFKIVLKSREIFVCDV